MNSSIPREKYLLMADQHRPLWAALHAFIYANQVQSLMEAGCGVADLSHAVEKYIGIDVNGEVLAENSQFYLPASEWIHDDWRNVDVSNQPVDMFLAAGTIERCDGYEEFLSHILDIPKLSYAIVTFHKGLRSEASPRHGKPGWFNNYLSESEVTRWLDAHVYADWGLYTLPHSRTVRWREKQWDTVLVMDWTWNARLEMFVAGRDK
jgi:hypothetical protein